jgi:hypothetical protein
MWINLIIDPEWKDENGESEGKMWCRKAKEIAKWYTNLDDEIY